MENHEVLTFTPVDNPDARVHRTGFGLTDPYVEHCWASVIGPSATLLLRRMPTLWIEREPARITHGELSRTLGLGGGSGANSRLMRSIDRVVRYGLAAWDREGGGLDVYLQAPELSARQLDGLPEWTRRAHFRLLDAHLQSIPQRDGTGPDVAAISARLDRIQQTSDRQARLPNPADTDHRTMSLHRRHGHSGSASAAHDHLVSEAQIRRAHICRFPFGKPARSGAEVVS